MRKLVMLILLVAGIGGTYLYFQPTTDPVSEVYEFIQTRGVTEINVELVNNVMHIQVTTPTLPELMGLQYDIAAEAAAISSLPVHVESYFNDEPIFALSGTAGSLEFTDIRSVEYKILTELSVNDVVVEAVEVYETYAMVTLSYVGSESEFWPEHQAMCLTVIQNAAWIDKVQINYRGVTMSTPITVDTDDVLAYYSGEITADQYIESITTYPATG